MYRELTKLHEQLFHRTYNGYRQADTPNFTEILLSLTRWTSRRISLASSNFLCSRRFPESRHVPLAFPRTHETRLLTHQSNSNDSTRFGDGFGRELCLFENAAQELLTRRGARRKWVLSKLCLSSGKSLGSDSTRWAQNVWPPNSIETSLTDLNLRTRRAHQEVLSYWERWVHKLQGQRAVKLIMLRSFRRRTWESGSLPLPWSRQRDRHRYHPSSTNIDTTWSRSAEQSSYEEEGNENSRS